MVINGTDANTSPILLIDEFEPDRFEWDGYMGLNGGMRMTFPRYRHPSGGLIPLVFQTGMMPVDGGIPTLGNFYPTDENRDFVRLNLSSEDAATTEFIGMLEKLDQLLVQNEDEIVADIKKSAKYVKLRAKKKSMEKPTHILTYRSPMQMDDLDLDLDSDEDQKQPKPKYVKLKMDIDFETKMVKTRVFAREDLNKPVVPVEVNTPTEMEKYLFHGCRARFILQVSKIWFFPHPANRIGMTLKILQVETVPPMKTIKEICQEYAFRQDERIPPTKISLTDGNKGVPVEDEIVPDHADEEVIPLLGKDWVKINAKSGYTTHVTDETLSEDESESDSDSEEEYAKPRAKKSVKRSKVIESDDSDEESEDEKERSEDEESEDESEIEYAKPSKRRTSKK